MKICLLLMKGKGCNQQIIQFSNLNNLLEPEHKAYNYPLAYANTLMLFVLVLVIAWFRVQFGYNMHE